MRKTLHLVIVMGVINAVGEESAPLIAGESDSSRGPEQAGDQRRQTVPLLGVDDDIVTTAQKSEKFGRTIVKEDLPHIGTKSKDGGIAFFRQDIDAGRGVCCLDGLDGRDQMDSVTDATGADKEDIGDNWREWNRPLSRGEDSGQHRAEQIVGFFYKHKKVIILPLMSA